jgi:acetoin utilization deacetylase AcuC-like enzyme
VKAFLDDRQFLHDPKHFMANGRISQNPEQPRRIETLRKGAKAAGCSFAAPSDYGMGPIAAVHSPEYLVFLQTIHKRWSRIADASEEVIPNIHPDRRTASYPRSAVGQAGFHQADTACPISVGTWQAAYWSAQNGLSAADTLISGDESAVYALCRPPRGIMPLAIWPVASAF